MGGLQPDVLPVLTSDGRDGFLARLLLIYPDRVPLHYTNTTLPYTSKAVWARYYKDLSKMLGKLGVGLEEKETVEMPFTEQATRIFSEWLNNVHLKEIDNGELSPMLEDAWAKLRSYLVRIAIIIQGLWHINGELKDRRIDDASVLNAIEVINYLKSHLRRSYDSLQVDPEEMLMQSILSWARRKGEEKDQFSFTPREIQQAGVLPSGINRSSRIKELLVSIKDHGYALVDDAYTLTIIA
ncbi:DUF3987 domain-containing protein (plasmid) [Alicyclobacillus curvatus]|nr:DUF3987 domain-containing protein [Alicyclobacillus curvatus]